MIRDFPNQRFGVEQVAQVKQARELRAKASNLHSKVSRGSYDEGDLSNFFDILEKVNVTLFASSSELGERAGLAASFFSSLRRTPRKVKINNLQRALTAIIDIANDRLKEVDRNIKETPTSPQINTNKSEKLEDLAALALSLSDLAQSEISRIDTEFPNDPDRIKRNAEQRELLSIFYIGFRRIAIAISALSTNASNRELQSNAAKAVAAVKTDFETWWSNHGVEAIDWAVRMPALTASIAMLNIAGADMQIGTAVAAASIGGQKIISLLNSRIKKK